MANLTAAQEEFCKKVGHRFRQPAVLHEALTHPSSMHARNNQRLEFLGDAVLGVLVAEMLFDMYPTESEGHLAKRLAGLICGVTLAEVARSIGLGEQLIIGTSEVQSLGRENPSNLEDACEALIGALYRDGGFEAARRFVRLHWHPLALAVDAPPKDAKTALQEWSQARGHGLPEYDVLDTKGPAHAPVFTVQVKVGNFAPQQGCGAAKRVAEQAAASAMLEALSELKGALDE